MKLQIILLIFLISLSSCGSKKKLVEKERVKMEQTSSLQETVSKDIKKDSSGTKTETKVSITDESTIELTQADPNKEITLIDSEGKETKIKGANAVISKRVEKVEVESKDSSAVSINEVIETDLNIETETGITKENHNLNLDVNRGFPCWIITLIVVGCILIIVVLYLVISYFRKTLNPLGWLR